jgi:hypothetical protein
MKFLFAFLLLLQFSFLHASEHPAEVAEARLAEAETKLARSTERLRKAILLIDDAAKQKATAKAFQESAKQWKGYVDSEIAFHVSATPTPDGSTATMLLAYQVESKAMEARAKELDNTASWLEVNYKK